MKAAASLKKSQRAAKKKTTNNNSIMATPPLVGHSSIPNGFQTGGHAGPVQSDIEYFSTSEARRLMMVQSDLKKP